MTFHLISYAAIKQTVELFKGFDSRLVRTFQFRNCQIVINPLLNENLESSSTK